MVKVQASPSEVAFCYEKNGYDAAMETARTFYCNQTFHVNAAIITAVDASVPLVLCEVAVYPDSKNSFPYLTNISNLTFLNWSHGMCASIQVLGYMSHKQA